mgnify:CR=1 FL=1
MKAHVKIEGSKVVIVVEFYNGMAGDYTWKFTNDCGNERYAGLAASALQSQLQDKMRTIRQEAYEDGYKDAKAKRKRKNLFSGWLS